MVIQSHLEDLQNNKPGYVDITGIFCLNFDLFFFFFNMKTVSDKQATSQSVQKTPTTIPYINISFDYLNVCNVLRF